MALLKKGSKGPEVTALQENLVKLGFDVGGVDGDFGDKTDKAVRRLQASAGLKVDGVVGKDTLGAISAQLATHGPKPPPTGDGWVAGLLANGKKVPLHLSGLTQAFEFFGKNVMVADGLRLDTDGAVIAGGDPTHQNDTSFHIKGKAVDSNTVPFVVMPGGSFGDSFNARLGDLCSVFQKGKWVHALVADVGPRAKFGEGSLELFRQFGFERVKANGSIRDVSADGQFILVFHANSGTDNEVDNATVQTRGAELLDPWLAQQG